MRHPTIQQMARKRLQAGRAREFGQNSELISFADYVKKAWEHVEPEPLVWNWHLDVLCKVLEGGAKARHRGESTHLAICVPPAGSKSLIASVLWQT